MPKRPFAVAVPLVLTCALAASCSSGSSNADAKKLITKSQSAVVASGAVHLVDVTKLGAKSATLTADIGPQGAVEVETVAGATILELRAVGTTLYLNTSSTNVLTSSLGLSATTAAASVNKWISIASTDSVYTSIAQNLTIGGATSIYFPTPATAALESGTTVHGIAVTPITSTATPQTKTTEKTTLFVATSTSLPVEALLSATQGSTTETKQATFSAWGKPVSVSAPSGAVTLASLLG